MTSRRKFIKQSAVATAGAVMLPDFLKALNINSDASTLSELAGNKVAVIIQLSGGNDGLNTVIPIRNDIYYKSRPKIAIPAEDVLNINKETGFHPQLTVFKELYDEGSLNIINSVGYQNVERSHMAAMESWQTARSGKENMHKTGWIGRYLDEGCPENCKKSYMAIEINDTGSLAIRGENVKGIAIADPARSYNNFASDFFKQVVHIRENPSQGSSLEFLYQQMQDTLNSIEYIYNKSKVYKTRTSYPLSQVGLDLKTVAELIVSEIETKVFYVTIPGFDTHFDQLSKHEKVLERFNEGLASFIKDLKANNKMEDIMIMIFSEFGRTLNENTSEGTDHGLGNNLFLINKGLKKPGFYNAMPTLTDLQNGGIKPLVDFKNVYATLLRKWLNADDNAILGRQYAYVNF